MRKSAVIKAVAGLAVWFGIVGSTVPASAGTQTVTGTVIDLYCYAANKANTGMDHGNQKACAWACVKYTPQPVGILTADGLAYELAGGIVANNNSRIAEYINKKVTVTGDVQLRDGMPTIFTNEVKVVP